MNKKEKDIASIYKILPIYEGIDKADCPFSWDGYLAYLDSCYIRWLGNKEYSEVATMLKGLMALGKEATHIDVKRCVFHMINMIEKGENNGTEIL